MRVHSALKVSRLVAPMVCAALARAAFAWGPDIAATTHEGSKEATGAPAVVSTSSRGLFMVRDNATNDCFDVMRSSDGGSSWYQFFWYCGGSSTVRGHASSIAVPEKLQDYMYVAFTEGPTEIRLLKVDLNNPSSWWWYTAASIPAQSSANLSAPKIITDNHDFGYYYLYLSYVKSTYVSGYLSEQAAIQVSTSKGTSWSAPHIFPSADVYRFYATCDAAYAHYRLYVAYTDGSRIYSTYSSDYGSTWSTPVTLYQAPNGYEYGWPRPRIAAIQDGSAVAVVYGSPGVSGYFTGVRYAFSPDGGASWGGGAITSMFGDLPADLTVDPSSGSFHLAFLSNLTCPGEICWYQTVNYSSAAATSPWIWSAPVRVNDSVVNVGQASIAVDWASKNPGIAWQYQPWGPNPLILFDRRDR